MSVKVASLAIFVLLNLDMYIAVRCAPCQSYMNPAERCMSVLNVPLQGVELSCTQISDICKGIFTRRSTLKQVRTAAQKNSVFKDEISQSLSEPINILAGRFKRTQYCTSHVEAFAGASSDEIDNVEEALNIFLTGDERQGSLFQEIAQNAKKFPKLIHFMDTHCRSRQYSFQITKCTSDNCWYCGFIHPPRLPIQEVKELHWLPDPVLNEHS